MHPSTKRGRHLALTELYCAFISGKVGSEHADTRVQFQSKASLAAAVNKQRLVDTLASLSPR